MSTDNPRRKELDHSLELLIDEAPFMDKMRTCSTGFGRFMSSFVFFYDQDLMIQTLDELFSYLPDHGRILEIEGGTGVLTLPEYKKRPGLSVFFQNEGDEESLRRMQQAHRRADLLGVNEIYYMTCSTDFLPVEDDLFDCVVNVNGFHGDPHMAREEIYRVLKPGGLYIGLNYVRGACSRTDFCIQKLHLYRHDFFEPWDTKKNLERRLHALFNEVNLKYVEGFGMMICQKEF